MRDTFLFKYFFECHTIACPQFGWTQSVSMPLEKAELWLAQKQPEHKCATCKGRSPIPSREIEELLFALAIQACGCPPSVCTHTYMM